MRGLRNESRGSRAEPHPETGRGCWQRGVLGLGLAGERKRGERAAACSAAALCRGVRLPKKFFNVQGSH